MCFSKLRKIALSLTILLGIVGNNACNMPKTYTLTQMGSDQILNGSVQKSVLNNAKLFPWFNYEYKTYQPNSKLLETLRSEKDSIHALVFAGSWCSDTQRELPRFYKIMDLLEVPSSHIELIMLDQNKKCSFINVEPLQIKYIPAFLFFKNGKEIGRIIEKPDSSLEYQVLQLYSQP
jgi:thiol-disulfide isomerase/thioredoxin